MTPGQSFHPGMELLQVSPSVLGWNDSRQVLLFWDRTTLGVILSWDRKTPGKSFSPRIERLQGSPSVLG